MKQANKIKQLEADLEAYKRYANECHKKVKVAKNIIHHFMIINNLIRDSRLNHSWNEMVSESLKMNDPYITNNLNHDHTQREQ